jgi:tRNA(fMet)-specific endonuclease VapC
MPRFLLDTNIASYLNKNANPALDYRVSLVPEGDLAISVITEAEMLFGLALLPAEANIRKTTHRFLEKVIILPWDSLCAQTFAEAAARQRRAGEALDTADMMIAAHALAYDLTLISNDAVFAQVPGLKLEDWSKGPIPA